MKVYELKSGDYLVESPSGVRTIVFGQPYELSGGLGIVNRLRTIANTIEEAGKATGPLESNGLCRPA